MLMKVGVFKGAEVYQSCRSRQMMRNEYVLADTAEGKKEEEQPRSIRKIWTRREVDESVPATYLTTRL